MTDITHVLSTLVQYFEHLPPADFEHFGEFIVTVVGTPTFVQVLKHFKNWHEEKVLIKWLTPIASGFTALVYLKSTGLLDTISLGNKATLVGAISWLSTVVYDIAVSPLYKRFIVNWTSSMAEASAYLNEVKPQAPAATLPTESPAPIPAPAAPVDANFNV